MAGSWIVFTNERGNKVLLCEESGVTITPHFGSAPGYQVLVAAGGTEHVIVGDIDAMALALGARSVP